MVRWPWSASSVEMARWRKNPLGRGRGGWHRVKRLASWNLRAGQRGRVRVGGYYGRFNKRGYRVGRGELKFFDTAPANATISSTGEIPSSSVVPIAQGTTENDRIGRKCTIKKILWRYTLLLPFGTLQSNTDVVRIILYQDKQCNGATIAALDLLETDEFDSFRNLANSNRFRILMDRVHVLNMPAAGGNGTAIETCSYTMRRTFNKTCNIPLEFDSTTGALTELRSNNIGVFTISRNGLCSMVSEMRLRFTG